MKRILLVHPDDAVPRAGSTGWDLIVDLGRAPVEFYEEWAREAACAVMSVHDLGQGTGDLFCMRDLVRSGLGQVVDRYGIDWWDVLVQSIIPSLQQIILAVRLAAKLETASEITCSRPHLIAEVLQNLTGQEIVNARRTQRRFDLPRRYVNVLQGLDFAQIAQVVQDKFDSQHKLRRLLRQRPRGISGPAILLPSAYINVTRTSLAYAAMLPDRRFLLMTARDSGRLKSVPANVQAESLDPYFSGMEQEELRELSQGLTHLCQQLYRSSREFSAAERAGVLGALRKRLSWGLAVRDAWMAVFSGKRIEACLCADDSNPYSRLPLIIARSRGIPAIACHHGALDSRMAIKKQHADFYLAKGALERDYLERVCEVPRGYIVSGAAVPAMATRTHATGSVARNLLVFFSEPYGLMGWRTEEIYRDLLPRLRLLASRCGLNLAFKLHPFESERGHRRLLRSMLSPDEADRIAVFSGPIQNDLWDKIACAMTVQSTVAIECRMRGIPIFLCSWLADGCAGYVQQYARFGVGQLLSSPGEIERVPEMLEQGRGKSQDIYEVMEPEILDKLFSGTYSQSTTEKPALAAAGNR